MKIGLVVPGGVDRSGEYRVIPALLALIRQLAQRHEVHVFSLGRGTRREQWRLDAATIHESAVTGSTAGVARVLASIGREHRRARFDVIQSLWAGWPGTVAVLAGKLLRVPSCVHIAGGELCAIADIRYGGQLRWYGRLRERLVLRGADATSAASRPILEQLAALGYGGTRIPLGVDITAWAPRAPQRRDPGEPARLIHVGSLNRVKDQATLLEAMRLLAQKRVPFALDLVGEDTLNGEIQQLARRLGLDAQLRFHGFRTQAQLRPMMEAAHLHVISSRHEAGPVVALEAAVAGVPTVGTRVGHLAEWAPEAASAVAPRDPAALAVAIETLLLDEPARLRMASAAQARALAEDAVFTAREFESLYRQFMRR
jgi:glycosyltransferase involved in cell wall biosynthesis